MAERTPNRPDFIDAYNGVVVPETVVSMDAIDGQVSETMSTFFDEIIDSLDLSPLALDASFERDRKMIIPSYGPTFIPEKNVYATDDFIELFRMKGRQVLAAVTLMRDDYNYQIAHFSKYPLLSQTEATIRELQRVDGIIGGLE